MYKHIFLENIKKLYTSAGNSDDQLQIKAILEVSVVSNPERLSDSSPISLGPPMNFKNYSARKPLCLFTEVLDVKKKISVRRVGAHKSNGKAIRGDSMLW